MASAAQLAKRTFVKVLLALALAYTLTLSITRGSDDGSVTSAFWQVARKVRPDKGGRAEDATGAVSGIQCWCWWRRSRPRENAKLVQFERGPI